jgi:hypothetical protein
MERVEITPPFARVEAVCSGCAHVASSHATTIDRHGVNVRCEETDCTCRYLT